MNKPTPDLEVLRRHKKKLAMALGMGAGPLLPLLGGLLSPITAGAVVVGSLVGIAAICWPFLSVLLTAAVVPLERMGRFTNDNSAVTFSLMRIFGLLGLASLLLHSLLSRRKLLFSLPIVLYGIYVFISALTLTFTSDFFRGFQWCSTMLGNLLFLFFVVNSIRSSKQVRLPVILWLVTTLVIGLYSIYEFHSGRYIVQNDRFENSGYRTTDDRFSTVILDYAEFETLGAVKRAIGATSHPAVYAINVILTIPFYAYLFRTTSSLSMRIFSVLGLGVGVYNVLLTNTRAAVVTLGFTLFCVFASKLVKNRLAIVCIAAGAAASAAPFLPQALYQRVFALSNYSLGQAAAMRARLAYWQAGVEIFEDHWLFGIGSGNQTELPHKLTNMYMPPNSSIHNEYFETLLETGIIGYPVMIAFLVTLFRRCRKVIRVFRQQNDGDTELFGIACFVASLAILLYGVQCDVMHFTLKGWWLVMGLIVGLSEMTIRQENSAPEKGLEEHEYAAT
jgi:hypothetical protein